MKRRGGSASMSSLRFLFRCCKMSAVAGGDNEERGREAGEG